MKKKLTIVYGPQGSGKTDCINELTLGEDVVRIKAVESYVRKAKLSHDIIIVEAATTGYVATFIEKFLPELVSAKHFVIIEVQADILNEIPSELMDRIEIIDVRDTDSCKLVKAADPILTSSSRSRLSELASDIRHSLDSEQNWLAEAEKEAKNACEAKQALLDALQNLPADLFHEGINTCRLGYDIVHIDVVKGRINDVQVLDLPDLSFEYENIIPAPQN